MRRLAWLAAATVLPCGSAWAADALAAGPFLLTVFAMAWGVVLLVALGALALGWKTQARGFLGILVAVVVLVPVGFIAQDLLRYGLYKYRSDANADSNAQAFAKFCAAAPSAPLIIQVAEPGQRLLLEVAKPPEALQYHVVGSGSALVQMLRRAGLACRDGASLAVRHWGDEPALAYEACAQREPVRTGPEGRARYQLAATLEKEVQAPVSGGHGPTWMRQVRVRVMQDEFVLGEDVMFISSPEFVSLRERCPIPELRIEQLLSGAFQLVDYPVALTQPSASSSARGR